MKTISNIVKMTSTGFIGVVALVVVTGSPLWAITTERPERPTEAPATSKETCSRITKFETVATARLTERLNAMKVDFDKRQSNIANRHDEVDQKVATFRTSLSDRFDAKVAELKSQEGLTDVKLAAIDTFAEAMKTAEAAREAAVDTARSSYRSALLQAVTGHQQKLSEAAATFQAAVKAAFATAKADCAERDASTTLRTAIKAARDVFASSRKTEATRTAIKQLVATRTESIKAANADFKQKAESYRATLKAAL